MFQINPLQHPWSYYYITVSLEVYYKIFQIIAHQQKKY